MPRHLASRCAFAVAFTFAFALAFALAFAPFLVITACAPREQSAVSDSATSDAVTSASALQTFAVRYTEAWCSQQAASVAAHFAEQGSLKINASEPAVGREAITASAQAFMSAFPDMVVAMDSLVTTGAHPAITGRSPAPTSASVGRATRYASMDTKSGRSAPTA